MLSVATVLTVYGIETNQGTHPHFHNYVATVLTVMIYVADCEVEAAQRNDEISILQLSIQIEGK